MASHRSGVMKINPNKKHRSNIVVAAAAPISSESAAAIFTPFFAFIADPEQVPEGMWMEFPSRGDVCPFTGLSRAYFDQVTENGPFPFDVIDLPASRTRKKARIFNVRSFTEFWMSSSS